MGLKSRDLNRTSMPRAMGLAAIVPTAVVLILTGSRHGGDEVGGVVTRGAEYESPWSTVDGGGVMFAQSDDGQYELSGTIGQPDAGEPMTGGGFQLTGGFWFETPPGDCDFDGRTDLAEYAAFERCLIGPLDARPPTCACYDVNRDGLVDLKDYRIFQAAFNASQ